MAYKIQHMSHNECVIEYEESKPKRDKPIVNFTIVTGGLIALVLGFNLVLILATIIVISFWRDLTRPRRLGFLIEFNRQKDIIAVKNTKPTQTKSTIFPLQYFTGLGLHEKTTAKGNRKPAQAVLFFKYREAVQTSPVAKKNGLLSVAKRLSDERDNVFWAFPIRKIDHPTSLENAREIVAAVHDWLDVDAAGLEAETDGDLNAPTEEAEIIRDFRDMD